MFWERGSLIATAITPIIVAIVSEALNRPAKVDHRRSRPRSRAAAPPAPRCARSSRPASARAATGRSRCRCGDEDDPFGLRTTERARGAASRWKLAVITGLLAAVIGAGVVTASELAVFGHSVGHSNRTTSVFGGSEHNSKRHRRRRPPRRPRRPSEDADRDADRRRRRRRRRRPPRPPPATATPQRRSPPTATPPATTVTPAPTP